MDFVYNPSRSRAEHSGGRFLLCYLLPPLLGCSALLVTVRSAPFAMTLLAASLVLGWTQIINYCGLAHTCALTRPVRNYAEARSWLQPITAYTFGGCVSAAITGATLGYLGSVTASSIPEPLAITLIVAMATAVVCRELGLLRFQLPEVRRQTRSRWFVDRPLLNPACWGFDVGFAFLTWQVLSGAYFLALVAILSGSPVLGIGIFGCYWLGRALPHLLEPLFLPDPANAHTFVEDIYGLRKPLAAVHALAVTLAATAFLIAQ
jgi:hypothetical protein